MPSPRACWRIWAAARGTELPGGHGSGPTAVLAEGRDAELSVRAYTVEGDPVDTYYRTVPDGRGIELFVDSTQDSFGSGRWEHAVCPGATNIDVGDDDLGAWE